MKRTTSVNFPFTLVLLAALILVSACSWVIWRVAIANQTHDLREDRFKYSINTIRSALESGLKLGFAAADIPGAQVLIDEARAREPAILSIDIFDAAGRTLFTTDEGGGGLNSPSHKACLADAFSGVTLGRDDDGAIACTVMVNSYQQVSGGIMIRSQAVSRAGIDDGLPDDWRPLLALLALFTVTGGIAGWWVVRPIERKFEAAAMALAGHRPAVDDELVGPVASALHQLGKIQDELCTTEAEAQRIDRIESQ